MLSISCFIWSNHKITYKTLFPLINLSSLFLQNDFNEYLQEEKQKLYAIQQKIQQLIVNVTQFIEEIEAIQNDEQLTRKEEKEKVCWWIFQVFFLNYKDILVGQQLSKSFKILSIEIKYIQKFSLSSYHSFENLYLRITRSSIERISYFFAYHLP